MKTRIYCKTTNCRKWSKLNDEGLCPSCQTQAVAEVEAESDDCICNICNEKVEEKDEDVIGCDLCENWCHQACVGSAGLLKLLKDITKANSSASNETFLGNLLWFCPKCLTGLPKAIGF